MAPREEVGEATGTAIELRVGSRDPPGCGSSAEAERVASNAAADGMGMLERSGSPAGAAAGATSRSGVAAGVGAAPQEQPLHRDSFAAQGALLPPSPLPPRMTIGASHAASVEAQVAGRSSIARRTRAKHSLVEYELNELETLLRTPSPEREQIEAEEEQRTPGADLEWKQFLLQVQVQQEDADAEGRSSVDDDSDDDRDYNYLADSSRLVEGEEEWEGAHAEIPMDEVKDLVSESAVGQSRTRRGLPIGTSQLGHASLAELSSRQSLSPRPSMMGRQSPGATSPPHTMHVTPRLPSAARARHPPPVAPRCARTQLRLDHHASPKHTPSPTHTPSPSPTP